MVGCTDGPIRAVLAGTKYVWLRREGILNWRGGGLDHAILEELNSVVQSAKRAACGFRNVGYFETMIFLRLGKLGFSAQASPAYASH